MFRRPILVPHQVTRRSKGRIKGRGKPSCGLPRMPAAIGCVGMQHHSARRRGMGVDLRLGTPEIVVSYRQVLSGGAIDSGRGISLPHDSHALEAAHSGGTLSRLRFVVIVAVIWGDKERRLKSHDFIDRTDRFDDGGSHASMAGMAIAGIRVGLRKRFDMQCRRLLCIGDLGTCRGAEFSGQERFDGAIPSGFVCLDVSRRSGCRAAAGAVGCRHAG